MPGATTSPTTRRSAAAISAGWPAAQGSLAEGIDAMLAGLAALEKTGTSLALSQFSLMLAQLYIRAGRWQEAAAALDRAPQGNPRWYADVERVRGELLLLRPEADPAAAENAYRASLDVARRQRAGLPILKSSLSLAEFLRRSERRQEARDVLAAGLGGAPRGARHGGCATRASLLESLRSDMSSRGGKPPRRRNRDWGGTNERGRSGERALRQRRDLLLS